MRLLYFASVRQALGTGEEILSLPEGVGDVAALARHLAGRSERHAAVFGDVRTLRAAINQVHVPFDHALSEGDEVAFFPPMTGG